MKIINTLFIILAITSISSAKVDLVTLPDRETVQLTIYNSADMTLARESRSLTLKEGTNELQFSWENTLIDPTSLDMLPKANAGQIDIANLTFPPRVRNLGLWNIKSEISGKVPIEITYLTSGLSWRAFYMGTLTENEEKMRLQGYVRVTNNSGEDYEKSQVRLIVGKVHMIDRIADLARRPYPYDRPGIVEEGIPTMTMGFSINKRETEAIERIRSELSMLSQEMPAEVIKEGLSEYFLYTIDGEQTIENGWSKRMISFDVEDVNVINLYKYEEERYGRSVIRFLSFTNDEKHELGETPIPGGMLKVYRNVDDDGHLSYAGQSDFKYIPVNEEVELNLGSVSNIVVEPKVMDFRTENHRDDGSSIIGWDEVRTFEIEVRNTRDIPVKVEIKRNFSSPFWEITGNDDYEDYDLDTIKFTFEMSPESKQTITYTIRTFHGTREDDAPGRRVAR